MYHDEFKHIGEKLFSRGMNGSHSGNISIRKPDQIFITRTGSMLDELTIDDIVKVDMTPNPEKDKRASMELLVHRAIYRADEYVQAVVHAHAPYSVVMAADRDEIVPYEQEGQYFFETIPVLRVKQAIASPEVEQKIGAYVKRAKAVIVSQHGVFAWGETLEDAYHHLMVVESACRINYLLEVRHVTEISGN